jgi:N4-gp56 family major capsid protein
MAVNSASTFSSDIENYIADKTLPLARRQLVAYQFGDPADLPHGRGTTYTASRYNRLPLPFAPLSEGVPPVGEQMSLAQVSATMLQWGDKVTITDVAELTIKHPLFKKAQELLGLQIAETLERNTFNTLMAGTQVNYVNQRGSRGALVAGDVLDTNTVIRTDAALETIGAPRYMGDEETNTKIDAGRPNKASENPRSMPHYVAIMHTLVVADFRQNADVRQAWTYSDLNRLYNYEAGEWSGIRFCKTNMVPSFTGVAQINPTAVVGGGTFANTNYFVTVTASDTQNQYESRIYQVSNSTAVAANGSMTVALPNIVGFTFNVYVGLTSSPANLALCPTAGPTSGPMAGQATQLAANQTVTITGVGLAQTPPAAPATGLTVYPTFVIGRGAYAQVELDDVKFTFLTGADKSDPLNQLRVIGWKCFYGTLISNQNFFARIESVSAYTATFG